MCATGACVAQDRGGVELELGEASGGSPWTCSLVCRASFRGAVRGLCSGLALPYACTHHPPRPRLPTPSTNPPTHQPRPARPLRPLSPACLHVPMRRASIAGVQRGGHPATARHAAAAPAHCQDPGQHARAAAARAGCDGAARPVHRCARWEHARAACCACHLSGGGGALEGRPRASWLQQCRCLGLQEAGCPQTAPVWSPTPHSSPGRARAGALRTPPPTFSQFHTPAHMQATSPACARPWRTARTCCSSWRRSCSRAGSWGQQRLRPTWPRGWR